jgi:hypothetical protein
MRRPLIILVCGLILAPAAVAAVRATGDGVLELRDVNADKATVIGRGAIWGQVDSGQLKVTDRFPADNLVPFVSGADRTIPMEPGVTVYKGKNIHFRFAGGRYQFSIVGRGIDLTAVGVGVAYLAADVLADDGGDFAVDNGKPQSVPLVEKKVRFGAAPAGSGP